MLAGSGCVKTHQPDQADGGGNIQDHPIVDSNLTGGDGDGDGSQVPL